MNREHWLPVVIGFGIVGLTGYCFGIRSGMDFGLAFEDALRGSTFIGYLEAIQNGTIALRSVRQPYPA